MRLLAVLRFGVLELLRRCVARCVSVFAIVWQSGVFDSRIPHLSSQGLEETGVLHEGSLCIHCETRSRSMQMSIGASLLAWVGYTSGTFCAEELSLATTSPRQPSFCIDHVAHISRVPSKTFLSIVDTLRPLNLRWNNILLT